MRTITVTDPGLLTTIQDLGRAGFAHLGVPRSGAVDASALAAANRLVGNEPDAAGLEVTMLGARLRLDASLTFAVTGAACPVRAGGRPVAWGEPVTVAAGTPLALGTATRGSRAYLAVSGGLAVDPVLGSRATDLLSGTGPAVLRAGDILPIGERVGEPADAMVAPTPIPHELRLLPGPRADWFVDLPDADFEVAPESNRIGLRMRGPALTRTAEAPGRELASEAMVLGAVQVPSSGQPVILLADHATTGGYPVAGVVHPADLAGVGQLAPGDSLRLRWSRV